MQRRTYLSRLGVLGAAGLAGCVGDSDGGATPTPEATPTSDERATGEGSTTTAGGTCGDAARLENGSFSCGTYAWSVGAARPTDDDGDPVGTNVAVTGFGREGPADAPAASDGDHALELSVDGTAADGGLWVRQAVDLSNCGTLAVDVHAPEASDDPSANVLAYAGPERELSGEDFDASEPVEREAGWRTVEYPVDHDGEGLVAVGIDVRGETEVVRYLDDVRVR